jgi:hypothetical protein
MSQTIHHQLIHGIKGLNAAQAQQLHDFLARVKEGCDGEAIAGEIPGAAATVEVDALDAGADGLDLEAAVVAEDLGIDGDLPQPVCAQDDEKASPELGWGPPPLMAVKFDVIACLIREANEARNARRQRYGL